MKGSLVVLFVMTFVAILFGGFLIFQSGESPEEIGEVEEEGIGQESEGVLDDTNPQQSSDHSQTHYVEIKNFEFQPGELKINLGDTVVWTNKDFDSHTVTSDSGNELDSPSIRRNQEFSHTFTQPGVFDYHCTPHPHMKAKIIVE